MKLISKFKLLFLTLAMVCLYFWYANNYTEPSQANETADLFETYNLTPEQVDSLITEYGVSKAEEMVEAHVNEQIANGAEVINVQEEWNSKLLEEETVVKKLLNRLKSIWE